MSQIIGIGSRTLADGRIVPTTDVHYDHYDHYTRVLETFNEYPIAQVLGLNVASAMELPLNQWWDIVAFAKHLKKPESDDDKILAVLTRLLGAQDEGQ